MEICPQVGTAQAPYASQMRYDWPPTKGELLDLNLSLRFTKDLGGPAKDKASGRPLRWNAP